MAYALVGSVGSVSTGSGSVTPSFAQATTAGNLLIAWVYNVGGNAVTTTDSNWYEIGHLSIVGSYVFARSNCGASETAPTFTNGGTSEIGAALAEFSGGSTSNPATDQSKVDVGSLTLPAADVDPGELLISADYFKLSKAGTHTSSDTYNNGATPSGNLNNDSSKVVDHYRFAYGITTGNSAADSNTVTSDSMNLSFTRTVLASFKLQQVAAVPRYGFTNFQNPGVF